MSHDEKAAAHAYSEVDEIEVALHVAGDEEVLPSIIATDKAARRAEILDSAEYSI